MDSRNPTALIVAVPEVESLVAGFRTEHDPACSEGVPAHVTLLYPFLPRFQLTEPVLGTLRAEFAGGAAFRTMFSEVRRFPGVLYLAPRPDAPFRELTDSIVRLFPQAPPYGGQFPDVVPHLTVAHASDAKRLEDIEAEFLVVAHEQLPIHADVREVVLIEKRDGRWHTRLVFPLGKPAAP